MLKFQDTMYYVRVLQTCILQYFMNPYKLLGTFYTLKLGLVAYSGKWGILENTVLSGW
jgi:hypothetical protein